MILVLLGPVFVEALDKCFENVCELDLIFHSDKVKKCGLFPTSPGYDMRERFMESFLRDMSIIVSSIFIELLFCKEYGCWCQQV